MCSATPRWRSSSSPAVGISTSTPTTDVLVASPDRVGKENTSSGHVADRNISKLCEGSRSIEKNKRHSSEAAYEVSKSLFLVYMKLQRQELTNVLRRRQR